MMVLTIKKAPQYVNGFLFFINPFLNLFVIN